MLVLELIVIGVALVVAVSIVWYTLKLGISPMPSAESARAEILQLIDLAEDGPIIDLGSGWGNLLIPLARQYPERSIVGYELSPVPWLFSVFLKRVLGLKNLHVLRRDFLHEDLSHAAVLICYLHPEGMQGIASKLHTDHHCAGCLISHNFALPSFEPEKVIKANDLFRSPIYVYRFG